MLKLKLPYIDHLMQRTDWKRPWCWGRLREGGKGGNREWDGWIASPIQWTWAWASSGRRWWQGSLACYSPCSHKESDITERLNWTDCNIQGTQWKRLRNWGMGGRLAFNKRWDCKWTQQSVRYESPGCDRCSGAHLVAGRRIDGSGQRVVLEWVAIPFSRGSSWPRDRTRVSCIAIRFFTVWATWGAPKRIIVSGHRVGCELHTLVEEEEVLTRSPQNSNTPFMSGCSLPSSSLL